MILYKNMAGVVAKITDIENPEVLESEWRVIKTAKFGMYNDEIVIFAKQEGMKILLSDDSETITNLHASCIDPQASLESKIMLNNILQKFDISCREHELYAYAKARTFEKKKRNICDAVLKIYEEFSSKEQDFFRLKKYIESNYFK